MTLGIDNFFSPKENLISPPISIPIAIVIESPDQILFILYIIKKPNNTIEILII